MRCSIAKAAIFLGGFDAVATSAQWLPIAFFPEKGPIALMRNDVVYDGCSRKPSDLLTHGAKGRALQKKSPRLMPLVCVPAVMSTLAKPLRNLFTVRRHA